MLSARGVGGKINPPCLANIEFGIAGEVEFITKMGSRGLSHLSFQSSEIFWVSDLPPYEKNKLLLNEYLGDFMHFETLFFVEMSTLFLTLP